MSSKDALEALLSIFNRQECQNVVSRKQLSAIFYTLIDAILIKIIIFCPLFNSFSQVVCLVSCVRFLVILV